MLVLVVVVVVVVVVYLYLKKSSHNLIGWLHDYIHKNTSLMQEIKRFSKLFKKDEHNDHTVRSYN